MASRALAWKEGRKEFWKRERVDTRLPVKKLWQQSVAGAKVVKAARAVRRHIHTAHPVSAQRVPERAGKGVPGSRHEPIVVHCTVDGVGSVRCLILTLTIGGSCVAVGLG